MARPFFFLGEGVVCGWRRIWAKPDVEWRFGVVVVAGASVRTGQLVPEARGNPRIEHRSTGNNTATIWRRGLEKYLRSLGTVGRSDACVKNVDKSKNWPELLKCRSRRASGQSERADARPQ